MPPYGLYSLGNTPEELLSKGYGDMNAFTKTADVPSGLLFTSDPAFGQLNSTLRFQPAPYTKGRPFQNMFDLTPTFYKGTNISQISADPSFGGISGYRDTGGIMDIIDSTPKQKFEFLSSAYEDDDEEQVEYLPGQEPKSFRDSATLQEYFQNRNPIAGIINLLSRLPTPMNIIRGGIDSLRGFNDRIRSTDFGSSRTLAEYFQKRRERKQAERAQENFRDVYDSARDQGFTNDRGGFSTNREDRAGTSLGSGQFSPSSSRGRSGY